jgi:hypothetical protein
MNENCPRVRELAPELALGAISGTERAYALDHLASCVECRLFVDELSEAADALLLLAPEAEPPVGFESLMLDRIGPSPRRRARRWIAAAAAAAVLASAGVWGGMQFAHRRDRLTREYVATLRILGGTSLRAAHLTAADGTVAGQALVYEGRPSWVFVALEHASGTGRYPILAELEDGTTVPVGAVRIDDGSGSWGGTITLDVDRIRAVSISDGDGGPSYRARFGDSE